MTGSRSFAPPAEPAEEEAGGAPPPLFPLLPYACTAYAAHCTRDYADYLGKLVQVDESWADDEALGLQMVGQMNRAFLSLVWGPIGAAFAQGSR